jgi:hypothetical protein
LKFTSVQKLPCVVLEQPPTVQSFGSVHGAPWLPRVAEHFVCVEKMVPVQYGALVQH